MRFPYPPGRWFVGDSSYDDTCMVHNDDRIADWLQAKGIDKSATFGLTTLSWSNTTTPWIVFVHRYALTDGRRLKPRRFGRPRPARRFPKAVRP